MIVNNEIPDLDTFTDGLACRVVRYGNDSSLDYSATNIAHDQLGDASFDLVKSGIFVDRITLAVNGDHKCPTRWPPLPPATSWACLWNPLKKD